MAFLTVGAMAQSKASDNISLNDSVKTKPLVVKTASVESASYMTFSATAYSLKGRMANGQTVHSGAIAADTRILPIGTTVYIDGMGTFTVKDRGGAIKGRRIDIWMPSTSQALKFGHRNIKLRIVSRPTRT